MQKLIFILIVSALAVWIGNKATKNPIAMDDVELKNLEALAQGEAEFPYYCVGVEWECWDDVYYQTFAGRKKYI